MSDSEPMEFDLDLEEIPITAKNKNGVTKNFVLREPDGKIRERILNKMNSRQKSSGTGVKDFSGMFAEVICCCLFDDEGKAVPVSEVNSWPAKAQDQVFRKVLKLAALDKTAEEEAKND